MAPKRDTTVQPQAAAAQAGPAATERTSTSVPQGEDGAPPPGGAAPGADGAGAGIGPAVDPGPAEATEAPGGAAEPVAEVSTEAVQADLEQLVAVSAQRDQYLALAQRTQADFENYRKRMARETGAAEARGLSRLARELLPALDNLQRALDASDALGEAAPAGDARLADGIRLVQAELQAALGRIGIHAYVPSGEPFDPAEHEAMAQHPVEGAAAGTVVEVYEPGYRMGESIIRPARVVVAA